MDLRGKRILTAALLILGVSGCYRTTELADLTDPGSDDPGDVASDPGPDVSPDPAWDPGTDVLPDAETDPGIDVATDADVTSPTGSGVWFASFRCPTLAGPIYPGVRIPADTCKLAIRVQPQPAVQTLEVYVGTGRIASIATPAETEEIEVKWKVNAEQDFALRARGIGFDGAESEDVVPVHVLPTFYSLASDCRDGLDLAVSRPDTWETVCGGGRLRASLAWVREGFGGIPAGWQIKATLGNQVLADVHDATVDVAYDIPATTKGTQSLVVTGTATLPPGGCCAGSDPCPITVQRFLAIRIGAEGCLQPACDVVIDGPADRVVEGDSWSGTIRLEPQTAGATVAVETDRTPSGSDFGAEGGVYNVSGLRDGVHEVRVTAHLPDGGTCTDRARFMSDVLPPVIEIPQMLNTGGTAWAPVVITTRDATVVTLDPDELGGRTCSAPEPRASGEVEWDCRVPMPANRQQLQVRVSGRDAAGHAGSAVGQVSTNYISFESIQVDIDSFVQDQTTVPVPVFGRVQVRVAITGAGLTPENLETMGFYPTVDGLPGEASGLSLRTADVGADLQGNAIIFGTWDTTQVPDGLHQVGVQMGGQGGSVIEGTRLATVRSGSLSGRETRLLQCDPGFSACLPFRSGHVAGNVGIRADVSWWSAAADPTIRIFAAGAVVATCTGKTCDWVLDWNAQRRTTVDIEAEAAGTGTEAAVRLGTSRRVVRDMHDLDDDGFRSVADGGSDCDDEEPSTHPGALDPVGPDCTTPGIPMMVPISEAPDDARVLDAARDASGTLHVILCDPGDRAFRYLRSPAEGAGDVGTVPGTGPVDCTAALARLGRAVDGTLRLALAPGDGTAGFAVLDDFPPVAEAIPTFRGRLAAVLPDGILAIQGCSLVAYRVASGTWTATTLRTECSFTDLDPSGDAAASVDPDGTVRIVANLLYGPTVTATLPSSGAPVFELLPQDALHQVGAVPPREAYETTGSLAEFDGPRMGIGRDAIGRTVVLESRMNASILAEETGFEPVAWTGGPGGWHAEPLRWAVATDTGVPEYVLRNHAQATLGITGDGSPVIASITSSPSNNTWARVDWPAWLRTIVRRGSNLFELPGPAGLEPVDPVAVGGANGAAEVVLRDAREGRVALVSWSCRDLKAPDSDCNGVDGPGGPSCSGACTPDLDAANRVAGSMPRCSGGVSDRVVQVGESCDAGAGGIAFGCRDCDFQDMAIDIPVLGMATDSAGLAPLATSDGTVLIVSAGAPDASARVLALDPSAPGLSTRAVLDAPAGLPFGGRPLMVQRTADIVLLAATWDANVGQGWLRAIRVDPEFHTIGSTTLDVRVYPRAALALPDGQVLFVGGDMDDQSATGGRLVLADPAVPATRTVFSWQMYGAQNTTNLPWSLVEGPTGDVALLRVSTNWNVDESPPASSLDVTALLPSTWAVRKEWSLDTATTIVSASLVPMGPAGYLVAWTEDTAVATEEQPAVPRLVRAQLLDPDLQPHGDPIALDAFPCQGSENFTVAASPLPASSGTGAVVVWGRPVEIGATRVVAMIAVSVDRGGTPSAAIPVFDSPLYSSMVPDVAVAGPDSLVVVASFGEIIERARFLDPRRAWGPLGPVAR